MKDELKVGDFVQSKTHGRYMQVIRIDGDMAVTDFYSDDNKYVQCKCKCYDLEKVTKIESVVRL